jgi:antibiotic biosynthesis monooxygenase (ABM) superfamily enzyme
VNKSIKVPVVEYEGTEQRFSIIFTSDVEEDDYSWRKSHRRDYYDWVEEQARKEKEEKEKQSF